MKIQCNACGAAEAAVLCCADEAALCWACDERVHAANKLAGKHQRVPLLSDGAGGGGASSSRGVPKCDICQEASGYFFCLEDRALLCRKCDVAVHTANPYVSAHQRFLLTGVRVGLDHTEPAASPLAGSQLHVSGRSVEPQSKQLPSISNPMSSLDTNGVVSSQMHEDGGLVASKTPISGFNMAGSILDWPLDEFFGFSEFNQNFGFTEQYSSKADSGKIGSSEGSSLHHITDDDVDAGECLGQLVPEIPWRVPEIPSPPTASGLGWQSIPHYSVSDAVFVPDISTSHDPTYFTQMPAKSHHRHRQRR
ncbi:B-box zinc finger protein 22-like [Curcuma longa]|uniref:B-box zinc finger protein 22-like n=1 Tax=Curcuma longa TaxID=136217 RepID=UPI003D9E6590